MVLQIDQIISPIIITIYVTILLTSYVVVTVGVYKSRLKYLVHKLENRFVILSSLVSLLYLFLPSYRVNFAFENQLGFEDIILLATYPEHSQN